MTDDKLAPVREGADDAEPRKAHYGDGVQPWDVIVAQGWGPAFAASNVIKYLRRTKNPEHSAENAAWYYDRLVEGAAGIAGYRHGPTWQAALDALELLLTTEERLRARRLA
jgi:hypothetical protein